VARICGARRSIRQAWLFQRTAYTEALADRVRRESADSHLRSAEAVTGYYIEASDGEIGHLDGFIVDDEAWAIRYIEVRNAELVAGQKGTGFHPHGLNG